MRKRILRFVWIITMVIIFSFSAGSTSYAYTEEEIQQAKAWLSAHGYSPDAGGANQAYQDYLDGKFDEELGINTTEQATTEATEETPQESSEKTTQTHQKGREEETGKDADISPGNNRNSDAAGTEVSDIEASQEKVDSQTEESVKKEVHESDLETDAAKEEKQEITLYQKQNQDTYKEAGIVVTLSVLLMVVFKGVVILLK